MINQNNQERTRTSSTNKQYIDRAINLVKRYEKDTAFAIDNEGEFINWLLTITTNKTDSNWRQLKASCVYYFNQIGNGTLSNKIERLTGEHALSSSLLNATSSQKKKSVSKDEESKLVAALYASASSSRPSFYDKPTLAIFNAILATGLRPCEWQGSLYYDQALPNIDLHPPILKVKNAKATNGRSFGEFRYIGLSELTQKQQNWVLMAVTYSAKPVDKNNQNISFDDFYEHLRKRIYNLGLRLFPRQKKRITLYSARHQLIADLKATGHSLTEIACIVGHGNDITATEHYGKKKVGTAKKNLPIANPDDISKIKQKFTGYIPTKDSELKKQ